GGAFFSALDWAGAWAGNIAGAASSNTAARLIRARLAVWFMDGVLMRGGKGSPASLAAGSGTAAIVNPARRSHNAPNRHSSKGRVDLSGGRRIIGARRQRARAVLATLRVARP